jgi:di/tricarboxylate transporter
LTGLIALKRVKSGGYRFIDYVKVGVPLTLVVPAVLMIVLPIFWPLIP